jgi:hypothetical protein
VGKMLIDASVTIAYKCTFCGSFRFINISLFTFLYKKSCSLPCDCKKSRIAIKREGENYYLFSIPCIGCGCEHTYLVKRKNILSGRTETVNCPATGMQICFIGKDEAVRKKIDSLEKEFDKLMDTYGYESYFRNTRVMLDTLNRLHDIAISGNLYCGCGSSDIELALFSDSVLLICCKCGGKKRIPAVKNDDLKEILTKNMIMITEDAFQYNAENAESRISRKSSDKFGK